MSLTANKGEWSEIYALFKLLSDRKLVIGDEHFNHIPDLFFPILEILREEKCRTLRFDTSQDNQNVFICSENGDILNKISSRAFEEQAKHLLTKIKAGAKSAFEIPETEIFMSSAHCTSIKASSKDKADIRIVIHDIQTGHTALQNFSIKSDLGSKPTLFNSNKEGTNFIYDLSGGNLSREQIDEINAIDTHHKIRDRVSKILGFGAKISFKRVEAQVLDHNLRMVDIALPEILAYMILEYFSGNGSKFSELAKRMDENNPLNFPFETKNFYTHKIKRFLSDVALGLMPGKMWDGIYQANGGYIVVRQDGELLCYHVFYRNQFDAYLLNATKLETPDPERHHFGKICEDSDGKPILKLNLQVRFR